jgi:hypothetical protein
MSNLTINQALSGLQNLLPLQQQVADADKSDSSGDPVTPEAANGQNVPDATAETAPGAAAEGSSAPVLSSDMTAVLLQLQESQEMTDARSLLYGDGSGNGTTDIFGTGTGTSGADNTLQAYLDQMTGAGAGTASSSSNTDPLLAYLEGSSTNTTSTDPLQAFLNQQSATSSSLMSSNNTLLDYLDATDGQANGSNTGLDALLA